MTVFSLFGAPEPLSSLLSSAQSPRDVGYSADSRDKGTSLMDQHEDLQELLTRLNNIRDSLEEALGDVRGIEDDYRRGLLEAHIKGAIREINAQITELVSSRK
jgi:signal transduction histidine kinase